MTQILDETFIRNLIMIKIIDVSTGKRKVGEDKARSGYRTHKEKSQAR